MSAIQQLEDALQERNKKTDEFLKAIIDSINESISQLPICTRSNSTPEVAGSVKVLRRDLDKIIGKIKDDSNIDEHAVQGLMSKLKLTNLKKQDPGLLPRSSEVDGARFSGSSVPRLSELDGSFSDRSSYQCATASPRGGRTRRR